ncbi:Maf family protein [Actinoalloteichus hymeniacidonis]|uniref:Nucleoside triphosphate pyrophosphatase n=1 Tax=Actinoalloteichus hymeniacidonis TaxID=340345 RepID=A0AAC9HV29_9PSEU|nr:Maf family protein [Actinoalloteichus hymeniacidonis]AOS65526.1 MAF protein [Actinoalloteichus hymeniacidonis]MBB5906386.1 septum formation protein [Actinoalloteichus hymeniacidonis]
MRFILASASPARLNVLKTAGIEPVVRVSGVDEEAIIQNLRKVDPARLVVALAAAKAEAVALAVAQEFPDAVIVGCDSMLALDGPDGIEAVGKPGTVEMARKRWQQMAGRSGELFTGHSIIRLEAGKTVKTAEGIAGTTVRFGSPSEADLEAYLATGEPLAVAGAFTLDGMGGWFVEGIEGDPSNVIGISLPLTRKLLDAVDVNVVSLWR